MKILKKMLCCIGIILAVVLVLAFLLVLFLIVREYKPKEIEGSELHGAKTQVMLQDKSPISLLIWNIGYCDLGDNASFFMSYGDDVRSSTKARAKENLESIISFIKKTDADIVMLQEADLNSTRSYHVNQVKKVGEALSDKTGTFAYNFNVDFIPFPMPPIGKVRSGLASYVPYKITEAYRQSLPVPFKWPVRIANLKRCLLVNRISIEGSDKDLVLINLHLEAFDKGEGKIAQTKKIQKVLEEEYSKGNYVIAGGDWNQVFSNTDVSAYPVSPVKAWQPGTIDLKDFSDHWQFRQDNTHPTCRATNFPYKNADRSLVQYYMLDGFVVSDNITIESVNTIDLDFVNSDHNPVLMKCVLNGVDLDK